MHELMKTYWWAALIVGVVLLAYAFRAVAKGYDRMDSGWYITQKEWPMATAYVRTQALIVHGYTVGAVGVGAVGVVTLVVGGVSVLFALGF